ncbi:hypothetical protein CK203_111270 [Vitis vinifera]|uniref:Endonuclease/exonuclease/phosphatase domain-containing protein n=1 Tax=Vitis vinifera TaxID=29760 RepID=A0A438CXU5_VITVI|nr:hypothetical protein CK203_111270 [Vitis vinifera]
MEEASRYTTPPLCSLFFLGKRDLSSSYSTPSGLDGALAEGFGFSGKELGAVEEVIEVSSKREIQEALEEGEEAGTLSWSSSCLAKFSRCIGMLTEGFKGEILTLLKRMKERKDQKGKLDGRKRKNWSHQGANDSDKRKVIKALIKKNNVDLVCLQETKIQGMSRGLVRSLGVGRFLEWGAVDSRGAAGVIVVFWDNRVLELVNLETGVFSMSCQSGESLNSNMRRISEVIEDLELKDLPLLGGPFTWSGGWRRSNKRPSSLFRFENMRLKVEGFKDLLKMWWEGDNFSGSLSFILVAKLKALKSKLKEWNRDVFGRVEAGKDLALNQFETLDALALKVPFTEEVFGALLGCSGDKAPEPDDFSMAFW